MKRKEFYIENRYEFPGDTLLNNRIFTTVNFLKQYNFKTMLDIGCNDGTITKIMAEAVKVKDIFGLEINEDCVEKAKNIGINCLKCDLEDTIWPIEKEKFDFIFCGEVIEHVFDVDNFVSNIYRILKPGGKLFITTPNLASWHGRLSLLLGYNPILCSVSIKNSWIGKFMHISTIGGVEHIRYFTLHALKDLLIFNGFKIIKVFGFHGEETHVKLPLLIKNMIVYLDRILSKIPSLATGIGIFCEKIKKQDKKNS